MKNFTKELITSAKLVKNGNICTIQNFYNVNEYDVSSYIVERNRGTAICNIANDLCSFVDTENDGSVSHRVVENELMDKICTLLNDKFYWKNDGEVSDGEHAILFFAENRKIVMEIY